jgi:hypothetical protein
VAASLWIATAIGQETGQGIAREVGQERENAPPEATLAQFASRYEQTCHATQAARLKALEEPVSELQKMQLEIIDKEVCPCMATRIAAVTDTKLAARIVAKDKEVEATFFEPAFQQCSVAVLRKMALPSCKEDIANSKLAPAAVEASCRCYSDAVAKLDDNTIRDDAVAAYLNYQARGRDQSINPYVSRLEVLRVECVRRHSK